MSFYGPVLCWTFFLVCELLLLGGVAVQTVNGFLLLSLSPQSPQSSQPPVLRRLPLLMHRQEAWGRRHFAIRHHHDDHDAPPSPVPSPPPSTKTKARRPPRIRRQRSNDTEKSPPVLPKSNLDASNNKNNSNDRRFAARDDIHPLTQRALIESMGLDTMTPIQAATYEPALQGKSILARSQTGTGKTLAYLLPALQRLVVAAEGGGGGDHDAVDVTSSWHYGRSIGLLVLVPTRELAAQIAQQAEALLTYHKNTALFGGNNNNNNNIAVACLYGGVKMGRDRRLLSGRNGLPAIVIATPGRLLEHLEHTRLADGRKFCDVLDETNMVVLDETDRLLEAFPGETRRILSYLARTEKRQTLLFSASFPRALRKALSNGESSSIVKGGIVEVDLNDSDGDGDDDTRSRNQATESSPQNRIDQSLVVMEDIASQYMELLLAILRQEMKKSSKTDDHKILVFFPTARITRFMYQFFTTGLHMDNLWEIHSRMSQSSRSRSSEAFRSSKKGILFSSDVSQRGLDYPDVSLVVQYGAPASRDDYIHRIGRTGRAGKEGSGLLVLMPFEGKLQKPRGVQEDATVASWLQDDNIGSNGTATTVMSQCRMDLEATRWRIRSQHIVLTPSADSAFASFLAHYLPRGGRKGIHRNRDKGKLDGKRALKYATDFATATGLAEIPALDPRLARRIEG